MGETFSAEKVFRLTSISCQLAVAITIFIFFLFFIPVLSRGEKGILAHPQRPPNLNENRTFVHFSLLILTETKLPTKNTDSSPIASRIPMRSHFCAFFPAKTNRNKITPPKSHFTYAIKHNFSLLILSTLFLHAIASISEKSPKFPIRFE